MKYRHKFLNYCVKIIDNQDQTGLPLELYKHIIGEVDDNDYDYMDEDNDDSPLSIGEFSKSTSSSYLDKLKEMVKTASSNSENIKIELCENFSEVKPELKITYKKRSGAKWNLMILPVHGVKSFTVLNVTGNLRIEAGITEQQKIHSECSHIGDVKWDKVISCLSHNGIVYGKDFGPHTKKSYNLIPWNIENSYLNVGVLPNHIKFEVGKLVSTSPNEFSLSACSTVFSQGCQIFESLLFLYLV